MICQKLDELLSFMIGIPRGMGRERKKRREREREPVEEQARREENKGGECIGVENEDQVGHTT